MCVFFFFFFSFCCVLFCLFGSCVVFVPVAAFAPLHEAKKDWLLQFVLAMNRVALLAGGGISSAAVGFGTGYLTGESFLRTVEQAIEGRLSKKCGGASNETTEWPSGTLVRSIAVDLCSRFANEPRGPDAPDFNVTVVYNDGTFGDFVKLLVQRQWSSGCLRIVNPHQADWHLQTVSSVLDSTARAGSEAAAGSSPGVVAPSFVSSWASEMPSLRQFLRRHMLTPELASLVLEVSLKRANSNRLRRRERPILFVDDVHSVNAAIPSTSSGTNSGRGGIDPKLQEFIARVPNAVRSLIFPQSELHELIASIIRRSVR